MLIWVHASITKDLNVALKFLDLIEVVDESLGDLFNQQRTVGHLVLNACLDLFVLFFFLVH